MITEDPPADRIGGPAAGGLEGVPSVRKLVYHVASTLDGFVAGPDGADPTGPDGFWPIPEDYLRHIVAEYPETLPGGARQALSVTAEGTRFDTVVEGRRSYEVGLAAGARTCGTWCSPPHSRRAPIRAWRWSRPTRRRRCGS